mgnify:FL=1|tara:strand:+ start:685 stop:1020 length:336 start_codon:yes stop_codon:yes gene_type:complete
MKYLYLALLITNFCSIVAKAEKIKPTHVGRELYTICFEMTDFAKQSYCLGFIMGVSDSSNSDNYCIPETAGGDQIRDHVLSFLHKHQSMLDEPAHLLIKKGLSEAYPCENL